LFSTFVALVVVREVQARKLVDTPTIAPEFCTVALRRATQADGLREGGRRGKKVVRRRRAVFLSHCRDEIALR
jgi:hypothetical protein